MNLIIIPFHDWRKSEKEGFRTRDVHFINSLVENNQVQKILVVNRPLTYFELLYKRQRRKLVGEVILKDKGFTLTRVSEKIYVVDYFSGSVVSQISKRYKWYIDKYADHTYICFIERCLKRLEMDQAYLIIQNLFAYKFAELIKVENVVFDAWDNFLKFPAYKNINEELETGYKRLSKTVTHWITNSNENILYYQEKFAVQDIILIKNGVKTNFVPKSKIIPGDLKGLNKPIIGFGGKISYLLNYRLINHLTAEHIDKSFVFVGQILDKAVFNKIIKRKNVFFLGDKHYDEYPHYVNNFSICIIPYNIKEGQHGGDSIKAYEYLLTGKKVVGTRGNGIEDLERYIYIADNEEEFSRYLDDDLNQKPLLDIKEHSWESKSNEILEILKK